MNYSDGLGWSALLLRAAAVTIEVSLIAFAIGLGVGLVITSLCFGRSRLLRHLAGAYVALLRGLPDLLIIYLLFFGGIVAFNEAALFIGIPGTPPPPLMTGAIAVGLIAAALLSEVFRGAVLAIDRGQIEAAKAFGMSDWVLRRRIIIPLALRTALPGIGNIWLSTIKGSSLVSVTGLSEILRQAQVAAGSTRQPFLFYSIAAVLYIVLSVLSSCGFSWLEWRLLREKR